MKRISLPATVVFLVEDQVSALEAEQQLVGLLLGQAGIEVVSVARPVESNVAQGWCRLAGGHSFYASAHWPPERPLPDICPEHRANIEMEALHAQHAPLFEALEQRIGVRPYLQHTGGGVWTFVIPLPERDEVPAYVGLLEEIPTSRRPPVNPHTDTGTRTHVDPDTRTDTSTDTDTGIDTGTDTDVDTRVAQGSTGNAVHGTVSFYPRYRDGRGVGQDADPYEAETPVVKASQGLPVEEWVRLILAHRTAFLAE